MQKLASSKKFLVPTATLLLLGIVTTFMEGCAKIPLSYSPGSVRKASGSVSISGFKYLPSETGKVKPFQIYNTTLGNLKFDTNIDIFFSDAVSTELRFVGVKLDDKTRILSGEIEDFHIDDLSYNVDWTLKVTYLIKNLKTGEVIYTSTKITQRKASKLVNISSALNEMIKLNIEELLKNEAFIKTIN